MERFENRVDARMARFRLQQPYLRMGDMLAAPEQPVVPIFVVTAEGNCSVCLSRQPNTVLNTCGHVFCVRCIRGIKVTGRRICPVCRQHFNHHRRLVQVDLPPNPPMPPPNPVVENEDMDAANMLLELARHWQQ